MDEPRTEYCKGNTSGGTTKTNGTRKGRATMSIGRNDAVQRNENAPAVRPSSTAGHPPSLKVRPVTRCSCDLSRGSLNEERAQRGNTTRKTGHVPRSLFTARFSNEQRQYIGPPERRTSLECEVEEVWRTGVDASSTQTTPAPPHDISNTTTEKRHVISTLSSFIREQTYLAAMQGVERRAAIPPSLLSVAPFDNRRLFRQHGDVPASTVFGGCKPLGLRSET